MTGFSTEATKNLSIAITIAIIVVMASDTLRSLFGPWVP